VTRLIEPSRRSLRAADGPPGAHPKRWAANVSPAVDRERCRAGHDPTCQINDEGKVIQVGVFKTETQQRITRERREQCSRPPAPRQMTA